MSTNFVDGTCMKVFRNDHAVVKSEHIDYIVKINEGVDIAALKEELPCSVVLYKKGHENILVSFYSHYEKQEQELLNQGDVLNEA
jgi:hypothetical protein